MTTQQMMLILHYLRKLRKVEYKMLNISVTLKCLLKLVFESMIELSI